MFAALPPSSSVSFTPVPASSRWIALPTSVEPVNATLSRPGASQVRAGRAVAGDDVDDARRQLGLRQMSAKISAVSGVVSAGLSTTVLPHASAGAIFQASISSGKFHGMIWPATPSGRGLALRERVLELVGPAGVVEEVGRGERDVDVARLLDRLAAVDRLGDRKLARPLLDQARDAEEVLRPLARAQRRPAFSKRRAPPARRGRRPWRRPARPRRAAPRSTGRSSGSTSSTRAPPACRR